jgi:hypothetical protein
MQRTTHAYLEQSAGQYGDRDAVRNANHNTFSLDAFHDDAAPHAEATTWNITTGTAVCRQHDAGWIFHADVE